VGLKIPEISWTWGVEPETRSKVKEELRDTASTVKEERTEDQKPLLAVPKNAPLESHGDDIKPSTEASISANGVKAEITTDEKAPAKPGSQVTVPGLPSTSDSNQSSPPPSRMRIYFHTPVTPDDSRPIPHSSNYYGDASVAPSDIRKGKRKKLEDDDGDIEEGRAAPPPPPQMGSGFESGGINANDDRSSVPASVAPSLTETVSEDWLMAAIVEGEEEAEAEGALRPHEEDNEDEEQMSVHDELLVKHHDGSDDSNADGKVDGEHFAFLFS
jgi:20S proteasome subunit alpha 6